MFCVCEPGAASSRVSAQPPNLILQSPPSPPTPNTHMQALDIAQGLDHLADQEFHSRMDFCLPWCSVSSRWATLSLRTHAEEGLPGTL